MIFVLNMDNFNKRNILIGDKEINLINYYNYFYRLYYSVNDYTMYGISIEIKFTNTKTINNYNHVKLIFNVSNNIDIINTIRNIEHYILLTNNKMTKYNLYNEFCKGQIKIQKNENSSQQNLIMRITGIWEDSINCGLSYKFMYL